MHDVQALRSFGWQELLIIGTLLGSLMFGLGFAAVMSKHAQATSDSEPAPAAWHPDPLGRHELRYWSGSAWTQYVSDDGVQSLDPGPAA